MWSVTDIVCNGKDWETISTHTLMWSVTINVKDYQGNYADFNSHAHVERDELTLALEYSDSNFNSHAHVERDTHFTTLTL